MRGPLTRRRAPLALLLGMLTTQCARDVTSSKVEHPSAEVSGAHTGHAAPSEQMPVGYAPVTVDPTRPGALDVETVLVEERDFTKKLRTVGVVALDETRTAHVHAKVRGWIDGINVNFVGRAVRAGEILCSIYSQEVYAAEIELLSILDRTGSLPPSQTTEGADPFLDAARRRLSLWDVPQGEIKRLQATREASRTFPLLAPRSGVVVAKAALQGMYVDPSVELYTVSDLSQVWVLADIYERDVPYVHVGDRARLTIEGDTEALDAATVAFIAPTIDEATRTLKARFQLKNRGQRFRPGAFVNVEMDVSLDRGLSVPETAVIRTGARAIVFVAQGERLVPREIALGPLVGDSYRVTAGLEVGERVAVGAQFLLDSESRLRASSSPGGGHAH